jgi:hypothetical protein
VCSNESQQKRQKRKTSLFLLPKQQVPVGRALADATITFRNLHVCRIHELDRRDTFEIVARNPAFMKCDVILKIQLTRHVKI